MFGNKKDGFKYENEVKALIQEATFGLNQRIIALESHNQMLIQELIQLKSGLYHDFQKLERRITDFTDIWNPFMQQNMNRIKEDLEKTIIDSQREDIKKVQADLECKIEKIIEESNIGLMDNILVGYYRDYSPIFAHKDSDNNQILRKLQGEEESNLASSTLILDSLIHFKKAYYDPQSPFGWIKIINKNGIVLCHTNIGHQLTFDYTMSRPEVKNIYKLCKELGIKFKIGGEDRVNGVPIKMIFEDE
jgi:hypothetical protein